MKDNFFGREYDIAPAGGETGQAFVATHEDEKFFLKEILRLFSCAFCRKHRSKISLDETRREWRCHHCSKMGELPYFDT